MRTIRELLLEDLNPQLGFPGGPCQVIQRIERTPLPASFRQGAVDDVESGTDLSNAVASKIYKPLEEPLPAGLPFKSFQLTAHAQYRMDQRGIAVPQMRSALVAFIKHFLVLKSQKHPTYERWIQQERTRDTIAWTDPKLGLTLVLAPTLLTKTLSVVTTYWQDGSEEAPPGDGGCALWSTEYARPAPRDD